MTADLLSESLRDNDLWISIKGESMSPFLKDGASVLVTKTQPISNADILIYRSNEQIIAHRLIRKCKDKNGRISYQTKADNGYSLDEPVSLSDVLGKVVAVKKDNDILRLNTFLGRIYALSLWFISITKLIIYKYAEVRIKG